MYKRQGIAHGAYETLRAHATPELQQRYLPRIVSGEWLATMCLTEAHAGTDLGLLRTRADGKDDPRKLTPRVVVTRWDDVGYRGERLTVSGLVDVGGRPLADRPIDVFLASRGGVDSILVGRGVTDGTGEFAIECDLPATLDLKAYEVYASTRDDARFNAAISD